MPLSIDQRLERLNMRLGELAHWRVRESREIGGWTFDGEAIELGAPWPRSEGVVRFEARGEAPETWPIDEVRLALERRRREPAHAELWRGRRGELWPRP